MNLTSRWFLIASPSRILCIICICFVWIITWRFQEGLEMFKTDSVPHNKITNCFQSTQHLYWISTSLWNFKHFT
jgi:hypothetical protein